MSSHLHFVLSNPPSLFPALFSRARHSTTIRGRFARSLGLCQLSSLLEALPFDGKTGQETDKGQARVLRTLLQASTAVPILTPDLVLQVITVVVPGGRNLRLLPGVSRYRCAAASRRKLPTMYWAVFGDKVYNPSLLRRRHFLSPNEDAEDFKFVRPVLGPEHGGECSQKRCESRAFNSAGLRFSKPSGLPPRAVLSQTAPAAHLWQRIPSRQQRLSGKCGES